jgi:hypothetical protein
MSNDDLTASPLDAEPEPIDPWRAHGEPGLDDPDPWRAHDEPDLQDPDPWRAHDLDD